MELRRGENLYQVFVVNTDADVILATGTTLSTLTAGQLAVFSDNDADSVALTNIATAAPILAANPKTNFFIAQNVGGKILKSASFKYDDITKQTFKDHVASSEQITWIGYDGSSFDGVASFTAGDDLWLTIIMQNPNERDRSQPTRRYAQHVVKTGNISGIEVGKALVSNLNKSLSLEMEANGIMLPELVSAAALNTTNDFTTDVSVTNGSKYLTHTTNANYATSTPLAVGDYVRFAAAGSAGTSALTDAVYRVEELISVTSTRLDRPVTGAITDIYEDSDGSGNVQVIPAAAAQAATWAIKITGTANQFDLVKYRNFYKNRFVASASEDFGTISIYTPTKAAEGAGGYQQVALDEYMSWGYEGQPILDNILPGTARVTTAIDGTTYATAGISVTTNVQHLVGGGSLKSQVLAYLGGSGNDAGCEVLGAFLKGATVAIA